MTATDAFWRFSLELYARPGVAETCLALQDAHGADVNMALFCVYAGMRRGLLAEAALDEAAARSAAWRAAAVAPLRALRRALKARISEGAALGVDAAAAEAVRGEIKAAELAAERAQQAALSPLADGAAPPPGASAARANLALLLARPEIRPGPELDARAAALLAAAQD